MRYHLYICSAKEAKQSPRWAGNVNQRISMSTYLRYFSRFVVAKYRTEPTQFLKVQGKWQGGPGHLD